MRVPPGPVQDTTPSPRLDLDRRYPLSPADRTYPPSRTGFPPPLLTDLRVRAVIITAHIRRMGEGNSFSLTVHTGGGGGCYPSPRFFPRSLVPGPFWSPRTGLGGPPPRPGQDRMGYTPLPGMGYPRPVRSGWGTPPSSRTEQQSEHLLRGWRYASCVHAEGLSCCTVQ